MVWLTDKNIYVVKAIHSDPCKPAENVAAFHSVVNAQLYAKKHNDSDYSFKHKIVYVVDSVPMQTGSGE